MGKLPDKAGGIFRSLLATAILLATVMYVVLIGLDPGLIRHCPIGSTLWQACRQVYMGTIPLVLVGLGTSIALLATTFRR